MESAVREREAEANGKQIQGRNGKFSTDLVVLSALLVTKSSVKRRFCQACVCFH